MSAHGNRKRWFALGLAAVGLLAGVPGEARADSERYDPFEGYGTHSLRLGLDADVTSGTLPGSQATYSQKRLMAEFNVMAFGSPTVFGTLLGVEFNLAAGVRGLGVPAQTPGWNQEEDGVGFTMRTDLEFSYDLIRWKVLALRQRLLLNAGGGFDYNSHPWQLLNGSEGWRAYPLIGGHLQSYLGDSVLLDVAYRYVPTQSKDSVGTEHRVQAALGIGSFMLGVKFATTQLLGSAEGPLAQTSVGGFADWVF
jgi:hypothetical protein